METTLTINGVTFTGKIEVTLVSFSFVMFEAVSADGETFEDFDDACLVADKSNRHVAELLAMESGMDYLTIQDLDFQS
jgi:hypothetical protein